MKRRGFTLIEVLVVVAIIALLIAILMPSLARAREVTKRTLCLQQLHMLGTAFMLYQAENKGMFVGAGTSPPLSTDAFYRTNAPGWVRLVNIANYWEPTTASEALQLEAIRNGALFRYTKTPQLYRCPATPKNEIRTYGSSPAADGNGAGNDRTARKLEQLKRPSSRIVHLDSEPEEWDAVWYIHDNIAAFWNLLALRHDNGSTFSFADGHSELWRWTDRRTILYFSHDFWWCEDNINNRSTNPDSRDNRDIRRIQMGLWGRLGYPYP